MKTVRSESNFMRCCEKNSNIEYTIQHFVAWTLKCATSEGGKEYCSKLSNYSKDILFFLLFGKDAFQNKKQELAVEDVKVWREWENLDVLAEITLSNKNKYVLCLELKAYNHTNEQQLAKYKSSIEGAYKGTDFTAKFVLLGAWDDAVPETDKACCDKSDFAAYTFENILDEVFLKDGDIFESSDNKLFDEFWTGIW
jgi:hypothetical protein